MFNIMDATIYKLLLWALPILLSILAFIGALAVKALLQMSKDINEIKVTIATMSERHDNLEKRVDSIDKIILKWN